jgi:hypothetical protein
MNKLRISIILYRKEHEQINHGYKQQETWILETWYGAKAVKSKLNAANSTNQKKNAWFYLI